METRPPLFLTGRCYFCGKDGKLHRVNYHLSETLRKSCAHELRLARYLRRAGSEKGTRDMSDVLRIGLLVPQTGAAGIWTPSAEACAALACSELNQSGGLDGQEVELLVGDAGETARSAAEKARYLVEVCGARAIVGMHPSYQRRAVRKALNLEIQYIFTPPYEGGEVDPFIAAIGETAEELLRPSMRWMRNNCGTSKIFFIGTDYEYPKTAHVIGKSIAREEDCEVVGEYLIPFGSECYEPVFSRLRKSGADTVVLFLVGLEAIRFNRAFTSSGLAQRIVRLAAVTDETIIYALGEENTENLFVMSTYLASIKHDENQFFLKRYHSSFGPDAPPINALGYSCYEGIYHFSSKTDSALPYPVKLGRQFRSARVSNEAGKTVVYIATVDCMSFKITAELT